MLNSNKKFKIKPAIHTHEIMCLMEVADEARG